MGGAVSGVVGGLFGSSNTPSQPNLNVYQPTGTAAADTSFQTLLNQQVANNYNQQYAPQAISTFNQQYTNPYAAPYQSAATNAGNALTQTGNNAVGASGQLNAAALAGLPGATQVLNMGFDPRNAVYNQTLQRLNDQTNVNAAQNGLTGSPYQASVANAAGSNFNIDWQNQQLQRALQGLQGYDSAVSSAGNELSRAGSLGTAGAEAMSQGGQVPYAASNSISGNQNQALVQLLNILNGGNTNIQQSLGDYMKYLQLGTGQSNAQAELNNSAYQNQLQASQTANSGLGGLAGSLFNGLNNIGNGSNSFSGITNLFNSGGNTASDAASTAELMSILSSTA